MPQTARAIDLEPIDRLEEKVRRLIQLVDQLRADHRRATEENARLTRELEAQRARVGEAERAAAEGAAFREERDLIRARVAEVLEQIEAIQI